MRRNFDELIRDLDGEPVRVGASAQSLAKAINAIWPKLSAEVQQELAKAMDEAAGKPLTLGYVCVSVLMGAYQDEQALGMDERIKRAELARRINKGGVQDVTVDDLTKIKPLLIKGFNGILVPVVAGELLEKDAPASLTAIG